LILGPLVGTAIVVVVIVGLLASSRRRGPIEILDGIRGNFCAPGSDLSFLYGDRAVRWQLVVARPFRAGRVVGEAVSRADRAPTDAPAADAGYPNSSDPGAAVAIAIAVAAAMLGLLVVR
jgi:hypothetical protein